MQAEVHQVGPICGCHRHDVFVAHDRIHLGITPAVDHLGHEDRLQQGARAAVRVAVHAGQDQSVEERAQAFGDKATGEIGGVAQHRHHVLVLEQGEGGPVGVQPGDGGHAQACHEILRDHRRIPAHVAVDRMQVDIAAAVVLRHAGKSRLEGGCCAVAHLGLLTGCHCPGIRTGEASVWPHYRLTPGQQYFIEHFSQL